jgi:hypothetical protein
MFVGGAEEQNLIPATALVAGEKVCRQLAAHKVA